MDRSQIILLGIGITIGFSVGVGVGAAIGERLATPETPCPCKDKNRAPVEVVTAPDVEPES